MPARSDYACCDWQGDVVRVRARVVPRSARSGIDTVVDGRLRVHLHAPPSGGRANQELIRLLAKAFGVPRTAVRLASGARARDKTLCIDRPRRLPPELGAPLVSHRSREFCARPPVLPG